VKYSNSNSYVDVWTNKGSFAKIYIKDTGIGIPQEDIPKIFERFYRVDKTRDRKTGGSGLGLSITSEIIRRHKGEIQIKNKKNGDKKKNNSSSHIITPILQTYTEEL
jgi:signal transduction histidine kinase